MGKAAKASAAGKKRSVLRDAGARASQGVGAARALSVLDFAQSRAAEVRLLANEISDVGGSRRAHQLLKPHLRRRSMSHNAYRLPRRLRARGLAEIVKKQDGAKVRLPRRQRRRRTKSLISEFGRRSERHHWLETHVYHAKRMHMIDVWGYRVASNPSAKSVRASYRAFMHHAVLHDASYLRLVELRGAAADVARVLAPMWNPSELPVDYAHYVSGQHAAQCVLYTPREYPRGAIGPARFVWHGAGDGSALWLLLHPAMADEALAPIRAACGADDVGVEVREVGDGVNVFQLRGPKCHAVLQEVLRVHEADKSPAAQTWRALAPLRSSASLQDGAVLGLDVVDPRLAFPPRRALADERSCAPSDELDALLDAWPTSGVAESVLWDDAKRAAMSGDMMSDEQVNSLKKRVLRNGFVVPPRPADGAGHIHPSVLLVQQPARLSRGYGSGWDVIVPRGWGMAFLNSFVFAGARLVGLRDMRAAHTEMGVPFFPNDFPDTRANVAHALAVAHAEQDLHDKKPPAFRVNFEAKAIASPFFTRWETVTEDTARAQPDPLPVVEPCRVINNRGKKPRVRGGGLFISSLKPADANVGMPPCVVLRDRNQLAALAEDELDTELCADTLVMASVQVYWRGKPNGRARVYLPLPADRAVLLQRGRAWKGEYAGPGERQLLGYVTAGGFSFVNGSGCGLAYVSAARWQQRARGGDDEHPNLVLVQTTTSLTLRPAVLRVCV